MDNIHFKSCSKCNDSKESQYFYVDMSKKDGLSSYCKQCRIISSKEYSVKNSDKIKEKDRQEYLKNREKVLAGHRVRWQKNKERYKLTQKKWRDANKERSAFLKKRWAAQHPDNNKIRAKRRDSNPITKLKHRVTTRIVIALKSKGFRKKYRSLDIIGCTSIELKNHLESQFKPGMTWDNHTTNGWHVDHIIPLASAKTEEELYKLNHYTNLQPLWAKDNYKKGSKCL